MEVDDPKAAVCGATVEGHVCVEPHGHEGVHIASDGWDWWVGAEADLMEARAEIERMKKEDRHIRMMTQARVGVSAAAAVRSVVDDRNACAKERDAAIAQIAAWREVGEAIEPAMHFGPGRDEYYVNRKALREALARAISSAPAAARETGGAREHELTPLREMREHEWEDPGHPCNTSWRLCKVCETEYDTDAPASGFPPCPGPSGRSVYGVTERSAARRDAQDAETRERKPPALLVVVFDRNGAPMSAFQWVDDPEHNITHEDGDTFHPYLNAAQAARTQDAIVAERVEARLALLAADVPPASTGADAVSEITTWLRKKHVAEVTSNGIDDGRGIRTGWLDAVDEIQSRWGKR